MKLFFQKFCIYISLVLLIVCGGCGKDDVEPKAEIVVNKYQAQPGELVTFSSTSINAEEYEWDLGNGESSDQETVKTAFDTPGRYEIKLKVKSKRGKTNETTTFIYVGKFYFANISIQEINFNDGNGNPWDTDGSGPDITFDLASSFSSINGLTVGDNFKKEKLPFYYSFYPYEKLLVDDFHEFKLIESPEYGTTGPRRIMKSWSINPIKEGH